jgi:UDP-N-acetyl-D-mannosaminuronic acid dehydrogenase
MASAVRPALEAGGGKAGKDFHLVHCPERLTAGKLLLNLTTLDRVLGAEEPEASERAVRLYGDITKGRVHTTDWVTAEVVKTAENAYWDLQIAFANELALLCEPVGVDANRARELINTCPGRNVLFPGAGVGGPCIPKDPWLLVQAAPTRSSLIPAARRVNDSMPLHMADLVSEGLRRAARALKGSKIVILGLSYRDGTEDSRNSPAIPLAEELGRRGAKVSVHDPLALPVQGISPERDLQAAAEGADALALVTAHEEYRSLDLRALGKVMRTRVLVDGRNAYRREDAAAAGFVYLGLGKPLG